MVNPPLNYIGITSVSVLFVAAISAAPVKQWDKRFGGSADDCAYGIQEAHDGGYIVAGHSSSGINGDKTEDCRGEKDYWVVKTDSSGSKEWDKRFGGGAADFARGIIKTGDGGYAIWGFSASGIGGDKSEDSRGGDDYWIVKIDGTGAKEWDKRFGGSGTEDAVAMRQTADGGYIVVGRSNSGANGDKTEESRGGYDYWIVKMDGTGVKEWDKRFGGGANDYGLAIQQTSDGGYIAAGWSASGADGDKSETSRGGSDYWIVKMDGTGAKEWDKRFGGSGTEEAMGIQQTTDGGYIIAGYSTSGANGDKTEDTRGGNDYWVVKTDSTGVKEWDKRFGGSGTDSAHQILQMPDGGYIVTGWSISDMGGDVSEETRGNQDYWMVKINSMGEKEWDKRFGGSGQESSGLVAQTGDGGIIVGGGSPSGINGDKTEDCWGEADYWILKVIVPPAITSHPQSTTNTVGTFSGFTVTAAGSTPLFYQWQKNGFDMDSATNPTYSIASVVTADAGDYRCVVSNAAGSATSEAATLTVNKATPTVTAWPAASAIVYGQALSASVLSGGAASVPGGFAFDAPSTTPNAGNYSAAATFIPTDTAKYNTVGGGVDVTVYKADQTIGFAAIPDQAVTNVLTLNAGASSGLLVGFAVAGPAVLDGNALSFTATGQVSVTASQPGNANWNPASNATRNFNVMPLPPAAPTGLSATDGTYADKVRVTWNAVGNADTYQVWRNTANNAGGAVQIASGVADTSHDDTWVAAGVTYYYWVKTVNAAGISPFSAPDFGSAFVSNLPPVIAMSAAPLSGAAPLAVTFDFSGSHDPDGTIEQSAIDKHGDEAFDIIGDGTGAVTVTYAEPGTFFAGGRVTDNKGATAFTSVVITVRGQAPVAELEVVPSSGEAPLSVLLLGTNSYAPAGRTLVAFEWDVDGDGVVDRISTNPALAWTYRAEGNYPAVLRVTDSAGMQASDTAEAAVAAPASPPPHVKLNAEPERGARPLKVVFEAEITSADSVISHAWDFDGDGVDDLRTPCGRVTNTYESVGAYQARVTVLAESGLAGTAWREIEVLEPSALKTWISSPKTGAKVWGQAVSLMGHAAPGGKTRSTQFQFKPSTTNVWSNLGGEFIPPPHAYSLAWNVTGLEQGSSYDLRIKAVDTDGAEAVSDVVSVIVAADAGQQPGGTSEGEVNGKHRKTSTFGGDETAFMAVYDGTAVKVPMDAVETGNFTVIMEIVGVNTHPLTGAAWGRVPLNLNRDVAVAGNPGLNKPVVIDIPYPDADNDGIVDGSSIREETLTALWYDHGAGQWKHCLSVEVFLKENFVRAATYRLTEFGLFGDAGARGGVFNDYSGNGMSDLAVFDQNTGWWYIMGMDNIVVTWAFGWGWPGAMPVPGDYDGDSVSDCAVFDMNTGLWFAAALDRHILAWAFPWGWPGAIPVHGDYDGDGRSDCAVFDQNTGRWYIITLDRELLLWAGEWGWPGAVPVPGDYDGDGRADMAVFDSNTGCWYIRTVAGDVLAWAVEWGWPGAITVPGDYDGDGSSDLAVFDSNTGWWYVAALQETAGSGFGVQERLTPNTEHRSPITSPHTLNTEHCTLNTNALRVLAWSVPWGWPGAVPAPGDYNGDGMSDLAMFDVNSGLWFIRTLSGEVLAWGAPWGWPGAMAVGGRY